MNGSVRLKETESGRVRTVALPQAILQSLNPSGEEGDDDLWGDNWRRFLTDLGVAAEAEDPDDADAFEEWVETAVKAFSDGKKFAERVKLFGNPEVSDAS
jgi:hypothetical protein